ncbi:MAG: hypothetical protein KAW45_06070 [Thermoplasmatales archaeon]|nr:hypothetical protein [Thermoplasmatales archaeon]
MRKMKIVAMLIATMFVGLTATSISGAVDLEADINVAIKEWIGCISPVINITTDEQKNQTVDFLVKVNETGEEQNHTYVVNDTLVINFNIDDQSNRRLGIFLFPRFVFTRLALKEDPDDILEKPIWKESGAVNVVRSLFDGIWPQADKIEEKLKFSIDKDTFYGGPVELYLIINTVGFLPGNINGGGLLGDDNPIIDRGVVKLTINFVDESTL